MHASPTRKDMFTSLAVGKARLTFIIYGLRLIVAFLIVAWLAGELSRYWVALVVAAPYVMAWSIWVGFKGAGNRLHSELTYFYHRYIDHLTHAMTPRAVADARLKMRDEMTNQLFGAIDKQWQLEQIGIQPRLKS